MARERDGRLLPPERHAGWFIAGGLTVLALVGAWLVAAGAFEGAAAKDVSPPQRAARE